MYCLCWLTWPDSTNADTQQLLVPERCVNVYTYARTDPYVTECIQYSIYVCVPLLCDCRQQGRKCGAGICAQQETDSQRAEEGRKRAKRWRRRRRRERGREEKVGKEDDDDEEEGKKRWWELIEIQNIINTVNRSCLTGWHDTSEHTNSYTRVSFGSRKTRFSFKKNRMRSFRDSNCFFSSANWILSTEVDGH